MGIKKSKKHLIIGDGQIGSLLYKVLFGGHCVIPNLELLDDRISDIMKNIRQK